MYLTRNQAKENQLELCDSCLVDEALELIDLIFDGQEGCNGCKHRPKKEHSRLCIQRDNDLIKVCSENPGIHISENLKR